MKKVCGRWLMMCGIFFFAACSRQKETVVNFQLEGLLSGVTPVLVTERRSVELQPDSLGFAVFEPVEGGEYALFQYGNYRLPLYFPRGKAFSVYICLRPDALGAEFSGEGALENDILNGKFLSPLNGEFGQDERSFVAALEKMRQERNRQLDSLQPDSAFISFMQEKTVYEMLGLLAAYSAEHSERVAGGYYPSDWYVAYLLDLLPKEKISEGPEEYENIWRKALKVAGGKSDRKPLTFRQLEDLLRLTDTIVTDPQSREFVADRFLTEYMETVGIDSLERLEDMYRRRVQDEERLIAFRELCYSWKKLFPGELALPVEGYTRDSVLVSTAEARGNYLYLLFWKTDCPASVKEWASLGQLHHRMRKKNIRFIGVALGEDRQKWEEYPDIRETGEEQWYAARTESLLSRYKLKKLPHALLIDPEGKITDADVELPSDSRLIKKLAALNFVGR